MMTLTALVITGPPLGLYMLWEKVQINDILKILALLLKIEPLLAVLYCTVMYCTWQPDSVSAWSPSLLCVHLSPGWLLRWAAIMVWWWMWESAIINT